MPNADDIRWFKSTFRNQIAPKIAGTVFTLDMLAALACQETGEVWPILRKKPGMTTARLLELCVGDTLDSDRGRTAFPLNKADLISHTNGQAMFDVARQALVDMAKFIPSYRGAASNARKFCHAFGIFQYDIQFLDEDPDYFLQRQYADFDIGLGRALRELKTAVRKAGLAGKASLTDLEMAFVGIAYNTGGFKPSKGLQQGHSDGEKFYGQAFFDFLRLAHTVPDDGAAAAPAIAGRAILATPSAVADSGAVEVVNTGALQLRIRSAPEGNDDALHNVVAEIPDGHPVVVLGGAKQGFRAVETSLHGATFSGFVRTKFLTQAPAGTEVQVEAPALEQPASGLVAVYAPRREGTVTKRSAPATPQSLNERGQPGRTGSDAQALREEIAAIIDWLAVEDPDHERYKPGGGKTYCNIYAHDFCFLAGVYLPRVWWSGAAIERIAAGNTVEPKLGVSIDEQRANDLFRWFRDFGMRFGWRRAASTTELQTEVNQGAIGIIVARRKEDGRSGHIVAVVPETVDNRARRDTSGNVVSPLQSQAGARNFRYGGLPAGWWNGAQFAESAFWLHA